MRILIDINHPAHVHLFRKAAEEWKRKGHQIFWVARDKDIVVDLLHRYGIEFELLSTHRQGVIGLALEMIIRDWKLLCLAHEYKPDVMLGTSVNITHVGRIIPARSIYFTESDSHLIRLITYLSFPFADAIVIPNVLPDIWPASKQVKHSSYHKLAYLHPNRFAPDPEVLAKLGVKPSEPFFIVRFIAWGASHDIGQGGLTLGAQRRIIKVLSSYGHVFISTEVELQPEFDPYLIPIEPDQMHDALYYATMFVGDSQSMTTEAAILGTPALRCNSMVGRTTVIDELEYKYDLCYGFLPDDVDGLMTKIDELLQTEDLKLKWQKKRERLLADKVDLTEWMVNFVEDYVNYGKGYSPPNGGKR
ncbi:DUF354 domain-containing protein [Chloroflexota bacterium]